jgi:hypothetical protein
VLPLEEAVLLLALPVDDEEGHFAANDGFEDFRFIAIGGDEEGFYIFADGFDGEGGDVLVE